MKNNGKLNAHQKYILVNVIHFRWNTLEFAGKKAGSIELFFGTGGLTPCFCIFHLFGPNLEIEDFFLSSEPICLPLHCQSLTSKPPHSRNISYYINFMLNPKSESKADHQMF